MGMENASISIPSGKTDLRLYCAFSFPAVAQTLGPERCGLLHAPSTPPHCSPLSHVFHPPHSWDEIRPLFQALGKDVLRGVRRTLAHSLHEVALVLGPDLAEKELENMFKFYLQDLEEVSQLCFGHIYRSTALTHHI